MPRFLRRALAVAAAAGLGVVPAAGTATAAPGLPIPGGVGSALCGTVFNQTACDAAGMISDPPQALSDAAGKVFGSFMPSNPVDEWVKSAAKSSAQALAHVQTTLVQFGHPHFLDGWYLTRYAVTFGIGIVVMAFTLTFLAARLSSSGPEGYRMLRQAGLSAPLYVPVMAIAPAAVDIVVQMIYALAGWLGQQASADTGTAIEGFVRVLNDMHDPNSFPLGELGLLLFCIIALLGAVLAMIENGIASFGAQLLMLVVPIVAAIALYPPARKRLVQLLGVIAGLLLTPVMLFLAYWVVWGAGAAGTSGRSQDPPTVLLFAAVGSLVAVSAPAVLGMLAPTMASSLGGHQGASRAVRGNTSSARRGATSGARTLNQLTSGRGSAGATGATSKAAGSAGTAAAGAATGGTAAVAATAKQAADTTRTAVRSRAQSTGTGHGAADPNGNGTGTSTSAGASTQNSGDPARGGTTSSGPSPAASGSSTATSSNQHGTAAASSPNQGSSTSPRSSTGNTGPRTLPLRFESSSSSTSSSSSSSSAGTSSPQSGTPQSGSQPQGGQT